jgi:L-ornithine N5-oxygenase
MTFQHQETRDLDVLGIGFGPSNIALAIALEETASTLDVRFIEAAEATSWQPQMLLEGSDIQNNPLRDLATPRNPQSFYSFTNYLKHQGRLFDYLNLGLSYPFRKEYALYVSWAASFFASQVDYGTRADAIGVDRKLRRWVVETQNGRYTARALILGHGRSRNIPSVFVSAMGPRVFHLTDYLQRIETLAPMLRRVAVVGASQSAVEINNDLLARFPGAEVHAIHRSFAMRQKDTSPFSDHVYFPEFVDYFFSVSDVARSDLQKQLRPTNYSSADLDVLHRLYTKIYENKLDGRNTFHLHRNTTVEAVDADADRVRLSLRERFLDRSTTLDIDAVVLATGFRDLGVGEHCELYPPILADVAPGLTRRVDGALEVARDYRVASETGLALYLNGLCESSHGLGDAGSFSLLSLRSVEILESLSRYFAEAIADVRAPRDLRVFSTL